MVVPMAFLLSLAVISVQHIGRGCPLPDLPNNDTSVTMPLRRWASLPDTASSGRYDDQTLGLWPAVRGHGSPIRYCFGDEKSADAILPYLLRGIALWKPTEQYSSLKIVPDLACYHVEKPEQEKWNWRCLCGEQPDGTRTDPKALLIMDGSIPEGASEGEQASEKQYAPTMAGLGYHKPALEEGEDREQLINYLIFSAVHTVPQSRDREAILWGKMAHELGNDKIIRLRIMMVSNSFAGHVIGLVHEHQRDDRDRYILFRPEYLEGYDDMLEKIRDPVNGLKFPPDAASEEARVRFICQNKEFARDFFPIAEHFMYESALSQTRLTSHDLHAFDFASIMIYSSTAGMKRDSRPEDFNELRCPLVRWLPGYRGVGWIIPGGDQVNSRISIKDLQRVSELYPPESKQKQAEAKALKQWEPMEVTIPMSGEKWLLKPNAVRAVGIDLIPINAPASEHGASSGQGAPGGHGAPSSHGQGASHVVGQRPSPEAADTGEPEFVDRDGKLPSKLSKLLKKIFKAGSSSRKAGSSSKKAGGPSKGGTGSGS